MIYWIKKLFGLVPSDDEIWAGMKSSGIEYLLGKQHNMVGHSKVPFENGGYLDLYYYPNDNGYSIATHELIEANGNGPSNKTYCAYEFCMFSSAKFDLSKAKDEKSHMGKSHNSLNVILNALARYSFQAQLNPKETMEFPSECEEELGGVCLIFDEYRKLGVGLMIGKKEYGLMVAIVVHRAEMEYARVNGTGKLIDLLKINKIYPNSDLNRPSVV